jgi:hypothetical protein
MTMGLNSPPRYYNSNCMHLNNTASTYIFLMTEQKDESTSIVGV